jgi:class 3 adenylate cyclase
MQSDTSNEPGGVEPPTPSPASNWLLSLALAGPSQLLVVLGDGRWQRQVSMAPWPPLGAHALPDEVLQTLARQTGRSLSLQLPAQLDAWPWERELAEAAGLTQQVPRYLTDLPEVSAPLPATPLVAPRGSDDAALNMVQAARSHQRPLVLTEASLPAAQRLALERSLRSHWRGPLLLSQALAQALSWLGLPADCCRLYGDGQAQAIDDEQGLRPVTALSVDLVGSTSLIQALGREAYAQRLQAHYLLCRDVILRFDGSLDAPQGNDGLMAYFGFPTAVENAAARALAAAWALSCGVASAGLQVRIGIASGQLAVNAQQAFGLEVHLAARLCSVARPGQILVAPSTLERVGAGFSLVRVEDLPPLKDFAQLKDVHALQGLQRSPAEGESATGGPSGFVGRQRELAALRDAWSDACAHRPRWCVVHGEAGLGKSRLLQEFSRGLRAQGAPCLALTGQAQLASSPFAAVVDGLRRLWAIEPGLDSSTLCNRLPSLLPTRPGQAEGLDELAQLLAHAPATDSRDTAPPRRWSELLLTCLLALSDAAALCLLVDDAHWLDPSSLDLLRRLRENSNGRALLVVLGERPESGRVHGLADGPPLELQRLTDTEAFELAGRLGAGLTARMRRRVVERAEGVPLFLEESLRMLAQRGSDPDDDVPATLQDLLMVRLDELGPDRTLAQLLSVLGREFSTDHAQALLALDDPFVVRARQQGSLPSLLGSGLLLTHEDPQPGLRFKHALIRDAAYHSIWSADRVRLHGLCADLIQRRSPELVQQRPEQIALHLDAAGRDGPARQAWLATAQLSAS